MAGGRERGSRTQRPWSVYRANTFELSNEMIGLALAGERSRFVWSMAYEAKTSMPPPKSHN